MDKDLEPVYDEQIAPLMAQIITITKEHQMPFVAVFHLHDDPDEGPLICVSALAPRGSAPAIKKCYNIVTERPLMARWEVIKKDDWRWTDYEISDAGRAVSGAVQDGQG